MKEKSKFVYKRRDPESVRAYANKKTGDFDSIVKSHVKVYKVKDGKNSIRILPPTWDNPQHYGYDLHVNYGIGADHQAYLSLSKMQGQPDPLSEARHAADKEGDKDLAKSLKPKERLGVWLVDREAEDDGPQFWAIPVTVAQDFARISFDEDTKETLMIDDLEEGYDLKFVKEGQGLNTKYPAARMRLSREPSPLHTNEKLQLEWWEYIQTNPIPSILQYYDYDHIASIFDGEVRGKADDDEDEAPPKRATPTPLGRVDRAKIAPERPGRSAGEVEDDDEDNPSPDEPEGDETETAAMSIRERLQQRRASRA